MAPALDLRTADRAAEAVIDSLTPPRPTAGADAPRRSIAGMSAPVSTVEDAIQAALATVNDPEIRRPITELGMVRSATIGASGVVRVELLLTVAGCPLKDKLRTDITTAVAAVPGVTGVEIDFGVMTPSSGSRCSHSYAVGVPARSR
ncbi:hypothetical protein GCM10027614_40420 [Micromonospora vulcania]